MESARLDALAAAFARSADQVLVVAVDGRVLYANSPARSRLGAPDVDATLARAFFPERAHAVFAAAMRAAVEETRSSRFEWGDEGPGGVRAWHSCTVSPMCDGDAVAGLLVTSSDVTSLKRSEERLRRSEQLLVDTQGVAHLGTWEWTVTEPNATWSTELYRIYGLTPETYTPSYEAYLTKIHPDDRQRVVDATNRVFHEHVPYSHDERIFLPDGSIRYLHTWAFPVLDDSGKLVKLVGVCQDITDRKMAEEEVLRLNADLEQRVVERTRTIEQSLRDLEAFQAMVSHDLRAPLSIMRGSCAILLESGRGALPEAMLKTVERMDRAGAHMTRLIEDLLSLAHVGNKALERVPVDISAMCEDIVLHLRGSAPERNVEVVVGRGLACSCDPTLLRAALDNLVGNAWKYTARTPHARIEVGSTIAPDGARMFFVRDNGAGFDMKDAHRLFVPFDRLDKGADFEGTGVGLAAVHRIVERHGGRIWAEAAPGKGATFFFTL